ncbi:MAG: zinc ribbon domain-containing protein [Candidatus Freyarchaeum deiterrae]
MASDLRDFYKKAVSDFFGMMTSEDFSSEFNTFFQEAEKSMHLLINSAPDVSILNEILEDAYSLAERVAVMNPSIEKKLKHIKDKHEELINNAVNKTLIQSEEKRLDKKATTEDLVCPGCNKPVSRDAEFCPYCGTELVRCMVCNSVIGLNQELIICPKCGGSAHLSCISKDNEKCPKCGNPLNEYKI